MIIDWVMLEQTGTFLVQAKYFTAWPYQSVNKYILLFLIVFYNINTVKLKGQNNFSCWIWKMMKFRQQHYKKKHPVARFTTDRESLAQLN